MSRDAHPPPSVRRTGVSHMSDARRAGSDFSPNCRPTRKPFDHKPQFLYDCRRDRPPRPPPDSSTTAAAKTKSSSFSPNFVIELHAGVSGGFKTSEVECVRANLKVIPPRWGVFEKGIVAARFFYLQWVDVLETIVSLWEDRLNGVHVLTPRLEGKLLLPSDRDELSDRLKKMFVVHVKGLLEGELVVNWEKKLRILEEEIEKLDAPRRRRATGYALFYEIQEKVDGLASEKELVARRIKEFKLGMECILDYLEGKAVVGSEEVKPIKLKGGFDWVRIHCLMLRECRRLDDGLPIYASREDILRNIHHNQVMVLSGETGSGKSTQLVQFLADSGVAGNGSIICTQPRKLAARSLAHRVNDESCGCYQDGAITCPSTYSSVQECDSKIMFMTDHCLLQHYMNDKNLYWISCVIVDEAHERSLNTDLLLALLKKLLNQRADLRLIIMSATADTDQLANYFFCCGTLKVKGRNFPVDIKYVPCISDGPSTNDVASYVSDVLRMVTEIHRKEGEGTILAFLTSQMEVEWACEQFQAASAVALPLHGKLSHDDQFRVYLNYPGKRKVIFTTNLAETSLTIPGVKYVVDSGMVKESRFEPGSGMNVLRVSTISQSSANQRAGRAGRTEPGKCYRLYQEKDFGSMPLHQEPEIRRVHLGVAVLRILALGIKNIEDFDFIDAPSSEAIEMAIRNLIQLGAVTLNNNVHELTKDGRELVKLGIEPRLGKIILKCFDQRLGREGLVLAAVMANSSTIFCRVGTEEDKRKSDRLKVQFCHPDGDLFTLLSVYKEWEGVPWNKKNQWCWDNSINAKSLRRCQETVHELESCLQHELNIIIPSYWRWNPTGNADEDRILKNVILSSLSENVAVYSGYDQLGYEVALTGKHVQLHPSCSLLIFGQRPSWVVFGEILAISNQYLVCVNSVYVESMDTLCPPPLFDVRQLDSRKLQSKILTGLGSTLLKKFCGKSNSGLNHLVSRIRTDFMDDRIGIEVDVDRNEVQLFASTQSIAEVSSRVMDVLQHEEKWLQNECLEKCLYLGGRGSSPVALLGAGAEIKHLELDKRNLTVDAYLSDAIAVDDKEFLMFIERNVSGSICAVHKFPGTGQETDKMQKWGRITFVTPDAAEIATKLSEHDFMGASVRVVPSRSTYGGDSKLSSFPALRAKVSWPLKYSKGFAVVKCEVQDAPFLVQEFSNVQIGGRYVHCEEGSKTMDSVVLRGLNKDLSEAEIFEALRSATDRKILDFFLVRGKVVDSPPPCEACEAALMREISPFMPRRNTQSVPFHVQVFPPEPNDSNMRALITFDGSLHLEVAKALEQIEGKVLTGCLPWQKIRCQQLFHSSVSCPEHVYFVIKEQLQSLLTSLRRRKGAECILDKNYNGSYRVKISANATKIVAELRRPLEHLMNGRAIYNAALTPTVLQLLFTRDGFGLLRRIQRETGTYILFDRSTLTLRVFGSSEKTNLAEQKLVQSLVTIHENKSNQVEVHLRGGVLPPDMMKKVVEIYGPDLCSLREKFPGAKFTLNTRRHVIYIHGSKDLKQKVEYLIYEIAQASGGSGQRSDNESACPICLCEVEDSFRLESCGHVLCASCLKEQCESAIRSQDTFPLRCAQEGCGALILITDLKSLLSSEKLEELFRASLGAFVASSGGKYRFCPSPDCPSVYRVAESGSTGSPFVCGACSVETCTKCHVEYHPYLSCEKYREFKEDPDTSLKDWCKGKEHVKHCPVCGFTIEKIDGCNHVECRCGRHICWVCLESFTGSDDCYGHLRSVHLAII